MTEDYQNTQFVSFPFDCDYSACRNNALYTVAPKRSLYLRDNFKTPNQLAQFLVDKLPVVVDGTTFS